LRYLFVFSSFLILATLGATDPGGAQRGLRAEIASDADTDDASDTSMIDDTDVDEGDESLVAAASGICSVDTADNAGDLNRDVGCVDSAGEGTNPSGFVQSLDP
jgi:hypothetical protein